MLIKVKTAHHADSFLLIDRVESVSYGTAWELDSQEAITTHIRLNEDSRMVLDPDTGGLYRDQIVSSKYEVPEMDKPVYRLNAVTYERDGTKQSVTFDTVAYICTDEGKTLERVLAGGMSHGNSPLALTD